MEKILIELIFRIAENASQELKEEAVEALNRLDEKAKATKNPFDDLVVWAIKGLF